MPEYKCPCCGCINGVKQIELIRSFTYLCPQEGCDYFDKETHQDFFCKKKTEKLPKKKKLKLDLEIEELERQIDPISYQDNYGFAPGHGYGYGYAP